MKFSLQTFLLLLTLTAIFGVLGHRAFQTEPPTFRQYFNSIEGSDAWFRVGSYSVAHKGSTTEFDLFYSDSDKRPDGAQDFFIYPNSLGLYCIWQLPDGSWSHKKVRSASRTTFHKIVAEKPDGIELQLRSNFRLLSSGSEEERLEEMKKLWETVNQPYSCKLIFENGLPVLKTITDKLKSEIPDPPDAG